MEHNTADLSALVRVKDYAPTVYVELKYATDDNFMGQKIYDFDEAFLRRGTALRLAKAQELLLRNGKKAVEAVDTDLMVHLVEEEPLFGSESTGLTTGQRPTVQDAFGKLGQVFGSLASERAEDVIKSRFKSISDGIGDMIKSIGKKKDDKDTEKG